MLGEECLSGCPAADGEPLCFQKARKCPREGLIVIQDKYTWSSAHGASLHWIASIDFAHGRGL